MRSDQQNSHHSSANITTGRLGSDVTLATKARASAVGSGGASVTRATRVLVANHREIPAGLMVDEVMGFRRFYEGEFSADLPPTLLRCERYLAGAFKRGAEVWPVFSVRTLLESQQFLQAAAS